MKPCLPAAAIACASALASAHAQMFFVTDYAGYAGSWTRYATLADAQGNSNPVGNGVIPQRNLGIYVTNGALPPGPGNSEPASIFVTNWYSSQDGNPGTGNTSNSSFGFLQIFNDPAIHHTSSASWDGSVQTLTITGSGHNIAGDSRFSPFNGLGEAETTGEFLSYNFGVSASGLSGVPNAGRTEDVTGLANNFTGSFVALFQNTGGNPALEGFYAINLTINNQTTIDGSFGDFVNADDFFAGPTPVPEVYGLLPCVAILGVALGGGWVRNRIWRRVAV